MPNPNPDLEKLAKLCPTMVTTIAHGVEKTLCLKIVGYELKDYEAITARLLELARLLDRFATGEINSDDWKRVEKILGKKFYIHHDGKTSTERSGDEAH